MVKVPQMVSVAHSWQSGTESTAIWFDKRKHILRQSLSLKSFELYYIAEQHMLMCFGIWQSRQSDSPSLLITYDTLLMQPLRQIPSTRQIHRVIAYENRVPHRGSFTWLDNQNFCQQMHGKTMNIVCNFENVFCPLFQEWIVIGWYVKLLLISKL